MVAEHQILVYTLLAASVSFVVLLLFSRQFVHWFVDVPNERSLHRDVTPRSGGIGIVVRRE